MRHDPTRNARNYSRHAEIHLAHVKRVVERARPRVFWRSRGLRTPPRQQAKPRLVQFGLAFRSDQPNNRLGGVQR